MKIIRPLHERLIIKENPVADQTDGGIFIPEASKEVPTQGIIRALGNNVNTEGENLKVGDEVMYMKYSGLPVKIKGEDLRMLLKNDILCVIEDVDEVQIQDNTCVPEPDQCPPADSPSSEGKYYK